MIDHIGIGATDFETSRVFYGSTLPTLGINPIIEVTPDQTGAYHGIGYGRDNKPFFWLAKGGQRASGLHIAFTATTRAQVDAFYATALRSGGKDNGPPGLRSYYHPNYYGTFIYDPDGVNVEAVCHSVE
jgi:catechol 2,3-dioxygenase-like lactoylglutathione lyase family enzyme